MESLLKSRGFCLNYCSVSHEKYWEYTDTNGNEKTNDLARIFGIEEDQDVEYVVLQCKEDFTDCKVAANDLVWSCNQEEFFRLIKECM